MDFCTRSMHVTKIRTLAKLVLPLLAALTAVVPPGGPAAFAEQSTSRAGSHGFHAQVPSTVPCPTGTRPTGLDEQWINLLGNTFQATPPAHTVIRGASRVRPLWAATCALERAPSGVKFCPNDPGVEYHLTFLFPTHRFEVTVDPFGCTGLWVGSRTYKGSTYQPNDRFWRTLSHVLGVPKARLFGGR
jgi:hypothetical protein